jgi:hypothetical protein
LQEISPVIIKMLQKNHSVQRYFQILNYSCNSPLITFYSFYHL